LAAAIIDAHQHFWDPTRRDDYHWMGGLPPAVSATLRRPFLPEHLQPLLAQHQVEKTILVQAAATEAEGEYLLTLAADNPFIAGVVVWLDMESPSFTQTLERFCGHAKFVGIRPMIQDLPNPEWMLGEPVQAAFALLEEKQVCFDFLVNEQHLSATSECLRRFPKLRAVVDHVAKPNLRASDLKRWARRLEEAARFPNLVCKLSGLVTEAAEISAPGCWRPADLKPAVVHALSCFGAERLMFGSDWPVCTLAASYGQVLETLQLLLQEQGVTGKAWEAIFSGTARRFYRI
jgi:L-fuconolactonase